MLVEILNRIFGSDKCGQRTEKNTEMMVAGEVEVKNEKQLEKMKHYDDSDLSILAEKYGELVTGKVITIELGEAARLLGRKRVRLDAFSGLIKKLHNDFGVELKIYSRRTKLNERKD